MQHTPQIKKAIQFAARKHHGHFRIAKTALPYITHLFSVALLLAESGAGEDVIVAALLHDTLEDTETTREELATEFSERVAELVESVSEIREDAKGKIPWRACKEAYITNMAIISEEALLVAIADKVDNVESSIEGYEEEGAAFLEKMKRSKEEYLWFYSETLRVAQERLPRHPLTARLAASHARQREVFAGGTKH